MQEIALLIQYMRIYTVSIGNAQQHLIDYTNNAGLYVGPDDPDYWNDAYLQSAMNARRACFIIALGRGCCPGEYHGAGTAVATVAVISFCIPASYTGITRSRSAGIP